MRLKVVAIVLLLAVAGAAVAVSLGAFSPAATSATTLLTAPATMTDVTDEIAATGTVEAASQYELSFGSPPVQSDPAAAADTSNQASGAAGSVDWTVEHVEVVVGDRVTAGEVLATAGTADLEAQIADAKRAADSAALQLKQAKADHADASGTAAKRQTQIAVYAAQSADAQARADLASLVALRGYTTIKAPAAGTVTAVAISTGADAPDGAAITMLSDDLRVSTDVVESDIASIKLDQPATVTVGALDATLQGKVVSIDPVSTSSGSSGVVSYAVIVALEAPPPQLRPGMSADISIVAASATNALAIPSRALSGTPGAYTVRVVAADGTVSVQDVEVGLVTSSLAEITSGLQAGDRVVTGTSSSQNNATVSVGGGGGFPGGGFVRQGRP